MKLHRSVYTLCLLTLLLAGVASGAGLWRSATPITRPIETIRGTPTTLYGQGLYQYDTVFIGAGFRGQDTVVLFLALPLLLLAAAWSWRGALRGHLLLLTVNSYLLYAYASMALAAAYNPLFLVYVGAFSTTLFTMLVTLPTLGGAIHANRVKVAGPRRGLTIFMVFSGVVTLFVWGAPLVAALLTATPPAYLDTYTTMVTYALDLAIITPSTFVAGVLIWRRVPLGYLVAIPLLGIIILLAPQIALSTYYQNAAGVPFTPGEIIGPIVGFVVLGIAAVGLLWGVLRQTAPMPPAL